MAFPVRLSIVQTSCLEQVDRTHPSSHTPVLEASTQASISTNECVCELVYLCVCVCVSEFAICKFELALCVQS